MIKYAITVPAVVGRRATIEIVEGKDDAYEDFDLEESGRELANIILRTVPTGSILALQMHLEAAIAARNEMLGLKGGK